MKRITLHSLKFLSLILILVLITPIIFADNRHDVRKDWDDHHDVRKDWDDHHDVRKDRSNRHDVRKDWDDHHDVRKD